MVLTSANMLVLDDQSNVILDDINLAVGTSVMRLLVTVYQNGVLDGQTRHAELVQAAEVLWRIAHDVITSNQLSGTITDRNGIVSGGWTYTPSAPS